MNQEMCLIKTAAETATPQEIHWLYNILREFKRATDKHGPFDSAHEGYAVILEEVDELWDEVKLKHPDLGKLQEEATQVAAMALRFLVDVTRKQKAIEVKGEQVTSITFDEAAA